MNFVLFGQDGLDRVIRSELAKSGCSVEMGAELQSLNQTEEDVRVKILHHTFDPNSGGTTSYNVEESAYKWVVGADGARGVVRKQAGMTFVGQTTELKFVLGDVTIKNPLPDVSCPAFAHILFVNLHHAVCSVGISGAIFLRFCT